jgi:hypothetical protein
VERGHGHSEIGGRSDGMTNGVGNIVELEIQENRTASIHDGLHNRGTLSGEKFQPYLTEGWGFQSIEQAHCALGIGNIESDDDFVLGSGRQFHTMRVF